MNECTAKEHWVDKMLRGIAGAVILIAVALYFFHSHLWVWFIGFVGLNLLQSAFTNWCPMMSILRKLKGKFE